MKDKRDHHKCYQGGYTPKQKKPECPFWCHCTVTQLVSTCRPASQAMMPLSFTKPAKCLLWACTSLYPEGIQSTAAQRLCIFTLVLSSFHLPPPNPILGCKSYNTDICFVVWFSCSKQMRTCTWAFSRMTHFKASFYAQHNSWGWDPFCMCLERVRSCWAVGRW